MMRINIQPISNVLGVLMLILGLVMMSCTFVSIYYQSGDGGALFSSGAASSIFGILLWKYRFDTKAVAIRKTEGYLIVTLAWLLMGIFSALPYYFSGVVSSMTDALFESYSGLTTTGATIFADVEVLPQGILLWRSLTHWLGGLGIIVLTVALFPLLGIAGIELFVAESSGPTNDKIHPRIKETAKRLWYIYVGLTIIATATYYFHGLGLFDAVNHAMSSLSTGGFSTKNASIAYYQNPALEYSVMIFMLLGGTNFFVIYQLYKMQWKVAWRNDEFRAYLTMLAIVISVITLFVMSSTALGTEEAFRKVGFMVISMVTTTGFVNADYTTWSNFITAIFFLLLFAGACAGSTSGGIKVIRHYVFAKNSVLEFKRLLHPRALIRIKVNKEIVAPRILTHILVFLLVYLFSFFMGFVLLASTGMELLTAAGASATALGNVGPAIGGLGPMDNFSAVPDAGKWILSFLMVLGRLELFTVLIIFTPYFWKANG